MKLTYSEIIEILWMARLAYEKDIKDYQIQSDIETIKKIDKLLQYINQSKSMKFILDEMPF